MSLKTYSAQEEEEEDEDFFISRKKAFAKELMSHGLDAE